MKKIGQFLYLLFCLAVAMISYRMYHDVPISIIHFIFAPIVAIYWLVTHQINLTLIKATFNFLLQ